MAHSFETEYEGEHGATDEALCILVGQDLTKHYPGHPWMVGVNTEAGTVVIDLGYDKPLHLARMAYMIHIPTLKSQGGFKHVMRAGGEILERFGVPRGTATDNTAAYAQENGLIADDTKEGAWANRRAGVAD